MFDSVNPKQSLPDLEEGILRYWREEDTFKRSIRRRGKAASDKLDGPESGKGEVFSFYDGPPFATGLPHYGHLLAGTIKDVIPRYQTMRGKQVERRFGWDCHGLPIENLIEKEHDIKDKQQIEEMGIGAFNDLCRSAVQRHAHDWREVVERMGRWVDMDWDYKTMDPDYMESIWWVFSQLTKKDLVYEGHKPMHICPRCATPLSNFEVTQGYADRTDMSVVMTFPLKEDPKTAILAWTTTPWSLPGNMWLAMGEDIEYAKVQEGDMTYVCATKLVEKLFKDREYEVIDSVKAKDLEGKKYEPLFPYFENVNLPSTEKKGAPETYGNRVFKIVISNGVEVSDEEGTGIVHLTSATGEDSDAVAKSEEVDVFPHVAIDGNFIDLVTDFKGLNAKPDGKDPMATDKAVIANLKERGRHFDSYPITHSYPHCWRCDTPLLPYTTSSWFVAIDKIKPDMLKSNSRTEWVPAHVRDGRFGHWLENARDWAISRNRYWGTPLPIWRTEDGDDMTVIGSRDDLMANCKDRFTKVTVLRHAESEGNLIPIYQGKEPGTDLTTHGQQQAQSAGAWLKTKNVDAIYCSPLARTKQTADAIAKETGAKVIVDDRLREVEFGDWEGKNVDFSDLTFVKERRAHKLQKGKPESIYHFEGMETWDSVRERIGSFLEEMLPKHKGEHIVVVSHADPVINVEHFFTKEDPVKLSHRPYPEKAVPNMFFWDHEKNQQLDLHKDTVDDITWETRDGKTMRRIPEVLDCWFESGSMPYAQEHFPFEMRHDKLKKPAAFPADFIAEGMDQTRGWFYTLTVLGAALFESSPFENCVVNGIVLAEDGKKMSKRLQNYPEPLEVVNKHGADAVRFSLMSSPAVRGEDLRFSEKLVEENVRNVLLPLWNTYSFFVTYANACDFEPTRDRRRSEHPLDIWIRAEVQDLVNRMTKELDAYDLSATCNELHETIDALTNWYVRLSRRRFAGKGVMDAYPDASGDKEAQDRHDALITLYDVLVTLSQVLAPFCPYITDAIYINLVPEDHVSVHLTDWPQTRDLSPDEKNLLEKTRIMRLVVSLGNSIRADSKVKVRQPLQKATVALPPAVNFDMTQDDLDLLRQELNVKEVAFADNPDELAESFVQVDARKVGPRLGKRVQEIINAGKQGEFTIQEDGKILILDEWLAPDEAALVYRGKEGQDAAADKGVVVSLDTEITDALQTEGDARDIIRGVQRIRKETGLDFTDTITLQIEGADDVLSAHTSLIESETRSTVGTASGDDHTIEVGDRKVTIRFVKR